MTPTTDARPIQPADAADAPTGRKKGPLARAKTRRRRRPRKNSSPCASQRADRERIEKEAREAGLRIGGYLRALALGSAGPRAVKRPAVEREQLARLLGELGKLGSNVNQIAKMVQHGARRARARRSWRRCGATSRRCGRS